MRRVCLITISLSLLLVPRYSFADFIDFGLDDSNYGQQTFKNNCTSSIADSAGSQATCFFSNFQTASGAPSFGEQRNGFLVGWDLPVDNVEVTISLLNGDTISHAGLVICTAKPCGGTGTWDLDVNDYAPFESLFKFSSTDTSATLDITGLVPAGPANNLGNPALNPTGNGNQIAFLVLSNNPDLGAKLAADITVQALPTPEPSSLMLMGTAAAMLFGKRLRRGSRS